MKVKSVIKKHKEVTLDCVRNYLFLDGLGGGQRGLDGGEEGEVAARLLTRLLLFGIQRLRDAPAHRLVLQLTTALVAQHHLQQQQRVESPLKTILQLNPPNSYR